MDMAQNIIGDRHIVGADSSAPAKNDSMIFAASASNGTPQVNAGLVRARNKISLWSIMPT